MNAARLEELAVFMEAEAEWSKQYGTPQLTQDYTDLARCARAWAKVERGCTSLGPLLIKSAWQHVDRNGRVRYGSTAIEAIEAAPEVKP